MFRKLKQKVDDELRGSPARATSQQQRQQQQQVGARPRAPSLPEGSLLQESPGFSPADRELLAGVIAEPALISEYTLFAVEGRKATSHKTRLGDAGAQDGENVNGDQATPTKKLDFNPLRKMELRIPSMESLFRTGSRDSLNRIDEESQLRAVPQSPTPGPELTSDIESESEEGSATPSGGIDGLSRDEMAHRLGRMERSLVKYRGRYTELVSICKDLQRDKEKLQVVLGQNQDRALRRISELREELQMDQQAKKHLQQEFDASLEEKDQLISVLQTQVALLKKQQRVDGMSMDEHDSGSGQTGTDGDAERSGGDVLEASIPRDADRGEGSHPPEDVHKELVATRERVRRQENLLKRCKETMRVQKERSTQLSAEKETLQEQLDERLQELEKLKELHTAEKTKLITQLGDAKNLIEQLEQDKGMAIAETKRQMHATLEAKEEEVGLLRSRLQDVMSEREELAEQKERADRAAFEELERTVGAAEEARRRAQAEMEERLAAVERAGEEERQSLLLELSRAKQKVVKHMKKSSEEQLAGLQQANAEALAQRDSEWQEKLSQREHAAQQDLQAALEHCRSDFLAQLREKEQQQLLALEEVELQKSAILAQEEKKREELSAHVEALRTRTLELESLVEKSTETQRDGGGAVPGTHVEAVRPCHQVEQEAVAGVGKQKILQEEHEAALQALCQQHREEVEKLQASHLEELKSKVEENKSKFQEHIMDMNMKHMQVLESMQDELEKTSFDLDEVKRVRDELESNLKILKDDKTVQQQQFEEQIQLEKEQHEQELGSRHAEELQKLNDKIAALEMERTNLDSSLAEAKAASQAAADEAQQEVVQLKNELQRKEEETVATVAEANGRTSKLSEDLENLNRTVGEKDEELVSLRQQLSQRVEELNVQLEEQKRVLEESIEMAREQHDVQIKERDAKLDLFKQKGKEMQEKYKKKLADKDTKFKEEIGKLKSALGKKEQEMSDIMSDHARKNSEGMDDALLKLEPTQRDQLQGLVARHDQELEELGRSWEGRLGQQVEELREKHEVELQEKEQMVAQLESKIADFETERKMTSEELIAAREELKERENKLQLLQEEVVQKSSKLEELGLNHVKIIEESTLAFQAKITAVEQECSQQTSKCEELENELSRTTVKLQELEQVYKELQDQSKENQQKIENACVEKEAEFKEDVKRQWTSSCSHLEGELKGLMDGCSERLSMSVIAVGQRLESCRDLTGKLKDGIKSRDRKLTDLEVQLGNLREQNEQLQKEREEELQQSSRKDNRLEQLTQELRAALSEKQELENKTLSIANNLSEREAFIEQLQKSVEYNNLASNEVAEKLKETDSRIISLETQNRDMQERLSASISLQEKDELIAQLEEMHTVKVEQFKKEIGELSVALSKASEEKAGVCTQVEFLEAKIAEMQKETETLLTQKQTAIEELQSQVKDLLAEHAASIAEKITLIEQLHVGKQELERQLVEVQSLLKENELEKDKLAKQLCNTETQLLQRLEDTNAEKEKVFKELVTQLEETKAKLSSIQNQADFAKAENEKVIQELKEAHGIAVQGQREEISKLLGEIEAFRLGDGEVTNKVRGFETEVQTLRAELVQKETEWQRAMEEIRETKDKELSALQARLTEESSGKQELKKKAEQRITVLKRQMEEKEKIAAALELRIEESQKQVGEKEAAVREFEERTAALQNALEVEKSKLESTVTEKGDLAITLESKLKETEAVVAEKETINKELEAKVGDLEAALRDKEKLDVKLKDLESSLLDKETLLQSYTAGADEKARSDHDLQRLLGDLKQQQQELHGKLQEAETEKNQTKKEATRLQKDLRLLRKEHQKEIDVIKQEALKEAAEKYKNDLEDLQVQHGSAIKQLIREFNTKMSEKEQELEAAVKEAMNKGEEVETELLRLHKTKVQDLLEQLTEKDAHITRTAQKYEEIVQSRDEEHQQQVRELQAALLAEQEQHQQREVALQEHADQLGLNASQQDVHRQSQTEVENMQSQLAEKTTLLAEARLQEQEFKEKIHSLQDQVNVYEKRMALPFGASYTGAHGSHDLSGEPTEFEYLRKVLFEYMMGRETKTLAKVITTVLKFTPEHSEKVMEREEARATFAVYQR
ncbi:golgin subfamily A member 4 isoform X3 [Lethenteron reissneri]|uniref:golgin subfamily A member 4 isoform X3 n=1 Tax=Lethenteron reissneri TaxID=7753 RepID=UPI002AB6475F|nr:golgin subfamily A member 4 isoform X3 [Lethenteron reissneri]